MTASKVMPRGILGILFVLVFSVLLGAVLGQAPDVLVQTGQTATLSWTLPDLTGILLLYVFNTSDVTKSVRIVPSTNVIAANYSDPRFAYLGDTRQSNMTFTLSDVRGWDAGWYRCGRNNPNAPIPDCGQRLVVLGRPTTPTVMSSKTPVVEGDNVNLTCSSQSTTLPADLGLDLAFRWTRNDVTVAGETRPQLLVRNVTRSQQGQEYACSATESRGLTSLTSSPYVVDVQYLPGPPAVSDNRDSGTYYQGETVTLTCTASGGNPPVSSVTLTCPQGHSVSSPGIRTTLTFTAGRNDVGRCECHGNHTLGLTSTAVANITTFYPPSLPTVTPVPGGPFWLKGGRLTLTCMSPDPGRPSATYVWLGDHGGSERGGKLEYDSLREEHNSRVVGCQAVNSFTSNRSLSLVSNLTLVVHYPPHVTVTSLPPLLPDGSVVVREGVDSLRLNCSASGNPSPSSFSWSPQGAQGGQLTFDPVTRDQHGLHTCTAASNSPTFGVLSSNVTINITVLYIGNVTLTRAGNSSHRTLTCQVQGRPASFRFGAWVQSWDGLEVRPVQGGTLGGQSTLTLTSYQDTGTYLCSVDNGLTDREGNNLTRTSSINVTVADLPVLLPDSQVQADEVGRQTRLSVAVYSEPGLDSYSWTFTADGLNSSELSSNSSSVPATVPLPVHGSTVMTSGVNVSVRLVLRPEAVGNYTLQACNLLGCRSTSVRLIAAGPPLTPEDLRVTNVSSTSVSLSWTPGYAGGDFRLWFLVEFRLHSQPDQWSVLPDTVTSSSVTVGGLQPGSVYVFRVRAQNSRETRNLSNYTLEIIEITAAAGGQSEEAKLSGGSIAAISVVVTFFLTLGGTLLVVYLVLRHRRLQGGSDGEKTNTYENVALDVQFRGPGGEAASPSSNNASSNTDQDCTYSGLDANSRDQPRDAGTYQSLSPYQNQRALRS